MSSARQDLLRLLESLPDDLSLPEIEARLQTALDEAYDQLSPEGITRFHGQHEELDGKVLVPGALQIAKWEGLQLTWSFEPTAEIICLYADRREQDSAPLVRIPLDSAESQIMRDCIEPGHWGYYELKLEDNDDRAAVNVSLITAEHGPISLIWFLDRQHRAALARGINRIFEEKPLDE